MDNKDDQNVDEEIKEKIMRIKKKMSDISHDEPSYPQEESDPGTGFEDTGGHNGGESEDVSASQIPYKGRYEADSQDEGTTGNDDVSGDLVSHSAPYKGRYEADQPDDRYYTEDAGEEYDDYGMEAEEVTGEKKNFSVKDIAVKSVSVVLSLAVIFLMVLNMPIIAYEGKDKTKGQLSVINFIKQMKPLRYKEGELSSDEGSDLDVDNNVVKPDFSDGLDLEQKVEGQYSVLLMGFDEGNGNSDVNWVFQFDIGAAKLNVLQIPRDTFVPEYTNSFTGKFNSVYTLGDTSKTPIQRVVDAVQDNFGIPIDAYVTTECGDIVSMVDLIGGIPITLDEKIVYEPGKIIPAGDVVLTGEQAEWFVRYRRTFNEGDIGRVKNQRKFLAAAMQKMLSIVEDDGLIKLYGYIKEIYDNEYIYTNLSLEGIKMLAAFASTLSMDNVQVNMVPGEGAWYSPDGHDSQSVWSVHKQAMVDMINKYFRPYQNDFTAEDSAITELVTNYLNNSYNDTVDTLDELQQGVEPGLNKLEEPSTESTTDRTSGTDTAATSEDYYYEEEY